MFGIILQSCKKESYRRFFDGSGFFECESCGRISKKAELNLRLAPLIKAIAEKENTSK